MLLLSAAVDLQSTTFVANHPSSVQFSENWPSIPYGSRSPSAGRRGRARRRVSRRVSRRGRRRLTQDRQRVPLMMAS